MMRMRMMMMMLLATVTMTMRWMGLGASLNNITNFGWCYLVVSPFVFHLFTKRQRSRRTFWYSEQGISNRTATPTPKHSNITRSTQQNQNLYLHKTQNGYSLSHNHDKTWKFHIWNVKCDFFCDVLIKINKYAGIRLGIFAFSLRVLCVCVLSYMLNEQHCICLVCLLDKPLWRIQINVWFIINCPEATWWHWTNTNALSTPIYQ